MVGIAALSQATLGPGPSILGLAVTPGSGLTVSVGAGQIYQTTSLQATSQGGGAAGGLPADTAHQIVKQGISLDPQMLSGFAAPATTGQSINYLVEAQYQDSDSGDVDLPFYNAANPPVQWTGPGNSGTASSSVRKGIVALQVKAGSAATTGSQTTPSTDSGWCAVAVVTVAHGQTTVVTGNITAPPAAQQPPLLLTNLAELPSQLQAQTFTFFPDLGTANAYSIVPYPLPASIEPGTSFDWQAANNNGGNSTLTVQTTAGPFTAPLLHMDLTQLGILDITDGMMCTSKFDGTNWQMVPGPNAWAHTANSGWGLGYLIGYVD